MAAVSLASQGEGHYALSGELSFDTVAGLLNSSRGLFDAEKKISIDLSGVTHSDSAGLALLIEWLRTAKRHSGHLQYHALPPQLKALASISEVDELLTA